MAVVRLVLGTEQTSALEHPRLEPLFDLALFHQPHERVFVDSPIALVALERFQNIVRRREEWLMNILRTANLL